MAGRHEFSYDFDAPRDMTVGRDLLRPEVRAERMREAETAIAELDRIRNRNAPRRQLYMSAGRDPVDDPPQYVMRSAALTPESTQTDFERAATAGANFLDLEGAAEFGSRMRRIVNSTGAVDWLPWGSHERADVDDFVHAGAAVATVGLLRGGGRYGGQRPVKSGGGLSYRAPKALATAKTKIAKRQRLEHEVAVANDEFVSSRTRRHANAARYAQEAWRDAGNELFGRYGDLGSDLTGVNDAVAQAEARIKSLVDVHSTVDSVHEMGRKARVMELSSQLSVGESPGGGLTLTPAERSAWQAYEGSLSGARERGAMASGRRALARVKADARSSSISSWLRKKTVDTLKFLSPWMPNRSLGSHAGHVGAWALGGTIAWDTIAANRAAKAQSEYAAKSKALRYQNDVNRSTDAFRGIDPGVIARDVEARDPTSFYRALDIIEAANVARTHPNAAGTTNRVDEAEIRRMVYSLPEKAWYNYGADRYDQYKKLPEDVRRKIDDKNEFDGPGMARFGKYLFLNESTYEAGQRRKQEAERMMQGGGR